MAYAKKFLVLKELTPGFSVNGRAVSGVARAEQDGAVEINLSLINFAAVTEGGYYAVLLFPGGKMYAEELGTSPFSFSKQYAENITNGGFVCLVAYVRETVVPVACGAGDMPYETERLTEFLHERYFKAQADKPIKSPAATEKPNSEEAEETVSFTPKDAAPKAEVIEESLPPDYDDTAVATENYYLSEDADVSALKIKEEIKDEQNVYQLDDHADTQGKDEDGGEKEETAGSENGFHAAFGKSFQGDYYASVKEELDRIFAEYPEEDCLKATIPDSSWVKVDYKSNYYLVGIVREKKQPRYICYGVPAKYSPTPPKELAGYCTFIPLSIFEMKGDGFWMLFQDAKTGECVIKPQ